MMKNPCGFVLGHRRWVTRSRLLAWEVRRNGTFCGSTFNARMIILPRQARDKHRKSLEQKVISAGLNAPMGTVELYETTVRDTWKVQAAMTTELDYGVANVTGKESKRVYVRCF